MDTSSIVTLVYLLIGAVVTYFEFTCTYKREIEILEKHHKLDSSMYAITVIAFVAFWPLVVAQRYATLLKNCKKGVWTIRDGSDDDNDDTSSVSMA